MSASRKRRGLAALGWFVVGSCAFAQQVAESSFRELFNGTDLTGWSGDLRYWSAEGGVITGRTSPENPLEKNTFLVADGVFGDFVLRLDYRIVGGNSGIQYRTRMRDDGSAVGYQADIEAGTNYTGIVYEENGRGFLCNRGERVDILVDGTKHDAGRGEDAAALQASLHNEDWNSYEIVANGHRIIHRINGRVFADLVDRDERHAADAGRIALQIHSGPPMLVQFRNVRIHEPYDFRPEPRWIWSPTAATADASCELRRVFELEKEVRQGWLTVTCDNHHVTSINGTEVARGDAWEQPGVFLVTTALKQGANELLAAARNSGGPAAFALILDIEYLDGTRSRLFSDPQFQARDASTEPWRAAASFGRVSAPNGPWPNPFGDIEATPASSITVPPGFVVERIASARKLEGSWVSLAFDPKGRLVVSPQSGNLLRITLGKDGEAPRVEPLPTARPIGDAHGLLFAHDCLYVSVNSDSKEKGGLWRLKDADGDDRFEIVERLIEYTPGGEHGGHGLVEGPDGKIYLMLGNHTENFAGSSIFDTENVPPKAFAATSPYRNYAEDLALKREWDANGHAVDILAPGGYVVRFDRDAKEIELFCGGFRNAYDLAFSPDGELFTYDSDMEWDIGLPWYRPTRVYHLTSGSDFGWRSGSANPQAYLPDLLPPLADIGLGSPTGIVFGTKGNFPAPYRSALFISDWTYGRIYAVHLEPEGSTYRGTFTTFADGKPLNLTDLEFGPDGALWFITGGRGTQSGLYRVSAQTKIAPGPIARFEASESARANRRRLERLHGGTMKAQLDSIFDALDSGDRFLRFSARVALERQELATWRDRVFSESRSRARQEAQLALVRTAPRELDRIAQAIAATPSAALDEASLLHELRTLQIGFARGGAIEPATREALLARYDARYPAASFPVNRELYAVLRKLDAPNLTARGVALLEAATVPEERIWHAWVLRDAKDGWSRDLETRYRAAGESLRKLTGGHSFAGFLDMIFGAAKREYVEFNPVTTAPPKWTLDGLAPELAKVGSGRNFESGRAAFKATLCAQCHRVGNEGGTVGPDLTGVSGRFSRRDLLDSIVDPSKVVSDQYQTTDYELKDGSKLVGRVVDQDVLSLVINVDPLNPRRVTVNKSDIKSKAISKISPMPDRLIDSLTLDQVLDLLAYLESGGNSRAANFAK